MTGHPVVEQVYSEHDDQVDREQQHRGSRGTRGVVALDLPEDVDRSNLSVEWYVAGDKNYGAELPHGAGEAQSRSGQDRGQKIGQEDPHESLEPTRPEGGCC